MVQEHKLGDCLSDDPIPNLTKPATREENRVNKLAITLDLTHR